MKIYIVRAPFAHRYIVEYMQNAEYYFNRRGYTYVWLDTLEELPAEPSIVFFFHTSYTRPLPQQTSHRIFLMNTEQLSNPVMLERMRDLLARHPFAGYVDYSMDNMERLNPACPHGWLPFVYHPSYAEKKPFPRVIPLLFYGWLSDYRKQLCEQYGATYVELYGDERDRKIRMSKCVLNAHFVQNYTIFESMRIHHAIFLGTPVFLPDCEPEKVSCLSDTAKKYLLKTPEVPDLPPLNPAEELERGNQAIDTFISCLSLPTPTAP